MRGMKAAVDMGSKYLPGLGGYIPLLLHLKVLGLRLTKVHGDVSALSGLVHLKDLDLSDTKVTGDRAALQVAIPGAIIRWREAHYKRGGDY